MVTRTGNPNDFNEILTVKEVAALLGISTHAVYRLITEKKIPARKAGKSYLFLKSALLAWLAGQ
jgi:excisionase family DNA binding protein